MTSGTSPQQGIAGTSSGRRTFNVHTRIVAQFLDPRRPSAWERLRPHMAELILKNKYPSPADRFSAFFYSNLTHKATDTDSVWIDIPYGGDNFAAAIFGAPLARRDYLYLKTPELLEKAHSTDEFMLQQAPAGGFYGSYIEYDAFRIASLEQINKWAGWKEQTVRVFHVSKSALIKDKLHWKDGVQAKLVLSDNPQELPEPKEHLMAVLKDRGGEFISPMAEPLLRHWARQDYLQYSFVGTQDQFDRIATHVKGGGHSKPDSVPVSVLMPVEDLIEPEIVSTLKMLTKFAKKCNLQESDIRLAAGFSSH